MPTLRQLIDAGLPDAQILATPIAVRRITPAEFVEWGRDDARLRKLRAFAAGGEVNDDLRNNVDALLLGLGSGHPGLDPTPGGEHATLLEQVVAAGVLTADDVTALAMIGLTFPTQPQIDAERQTIVREARAAETQATRDSIVAIYNNAVSVLDSYRDNGGTAPTLDALLAWRPQS